MSKHQIGWASELTATSRRKERTKSIAIIALFALLIVWTGFQPPIEAKTPQGAESQATNDAGGGQIATTPKPLQNETPSIEDRIRKQAAYYGVEESVALAYAACESSMNPYAQNPVSSAKGLYQFTDGTWEYIKAQGHQFDADENIRQFMIWYPVHPEWWTSCE